MGKFKRIVIETVEWYLQTLKSQTLKRNPNANTALLDRLSADTSLIVAYGLGILFAFLSFVSMLTYFFDGFRSISLVGAVCALLLASIFHPKTKGRFEFLNHGFARKTRWGVYFLLFIFTALGSSPSPERQRAIEQAREEREQAREEREQAREEREHIEEREATRLEEEKDDIKIENNRQEEFYDKLGAPKLLYRCKGTAIVKAIGATIGTYNLLLSSANRECGEDNVEILDKEE